MAALPLGIRAALKYQAVDTAEVAYNILHFMRPIGSLSFATAVDALHSNIADNALGGWAFAWQTVGHVNASLTEVTYYDLSTDPVTSVIVKTTALPIAGGSGDPALPYQNAIGLSLRTGNDSRRGRGRVYLPYVGGASLELTTGLIPAAGRDTIDTRFTTFRDEIDTEPAIDYWGVYSRLDNVIRRVVSVRVGVVPDTIRRRRNKRGENYSA